ncbi:MAG: sigma-70 family RNA polymerase sigma factor [Victivallales bacterium]|nr:sigma-70 family RNA polymerase sigma factor [Victivallales bacterium]
MTETENSNDMQLVERCRLGDERAFEILYARYRLPLFSYLHKLLVGNPSLVDDIFQQVWIKANRNWDKYSDQQKLLAWLCRIAHNAVMDHYRKSRRMPMVEMTEQMDFANDSDTGHSIDQKAFDDALEAAIADLSEDQREVVELRRQGVSFKEIAERQQTNLNTALCRMHYAISNLRNKLKDFMD